MKVLLIPPKSNYPNPAPNIQLVPLGFPYIASVLKRQGIDVIGLTLNYIHCSRHVLKNKVKEAIKFYRPDFIGVGGLSAEYLFVRDVIKTVRSNSRIPIILGGGLISSDPDFIMNDLKPDFGVLGEGEETILEIVRGNDRETIKGIAYWDERTNRPIFNERRKSIKNLDSLPFPEYDIFDIERFFELSNNFDNYFYARTRTNPRIIPVSGARSCPFRCTFCWHAEPYRKRSIDNVIEEIIYMYEKHHFNILMVYDEMMGKNRAREFSQRMKELKLDIDWSCSMRVPNVDADTLKLMKDSGCTYIGYGFESASQKVLDSMNKKITVEQIKKAIELTERAGLGVQANFIYGDPAETPETMRETNEFFDRYCRNHIVHRYYIYPFPGSEVFEHCIRNRIITDKKEFYETIHTFPIYNMTKMDDETFLGLLRPALEDNNYKMAGAHAREENLKNRVDAVCPHCNREVEYIFPARYDIIYLPTAKVICSKCHKRFNIPTKPLLWPTMKNFLKQGRVVDFLRTVRLYLKRALSK